MRFEHHPQSELYFEYDWTLGMVWCVGQKEWIWFTTPGNKSEERKKMQAESEQKKFPKCPYLLEHVLNHAE